MVGFWCCPSCTLENPESRRRCGACENRRPVDLKPRSPSTLSVDIPLSSNQGRKSPRKSPSPHETRKLVRLVLVLDGTPFCTNEELEASLSIKECEGISVVAAESHNSPFQEKERLHAIQERDPAKENSTPAVGTPFTSSPNFANSQESSSLHGTFQYTPCTQEYYSMSQQYCDEKEEAGPGNHLPRSSPDAAPTASTSLKTHDHPSKCDPPANRTKECSLLRNTIPHSAKLQEPNDEVERVPLRGLDGNQPDTTSDNITRRPCKSTDDSSTCASPFTETGFSTDDNKNQIIMDEASLETAAKMLNNALLEPGDNSFSRRASLESPPMPQCTIPSFSTAGSHRSISVDAASLERASALLGSKSPSMENAKKAGSANPPPSVQGVCFSTAGSHRSISVDAASLERADALLFNETSIPSTISAQIYVGREPSCYKRRSMDQLSFSVEGSSNSDTNTRAPCVDIRNTSNLITPSSRVDQATLDRAKSLYENLPEVEQGHSLEQLMDDDTVPDHSQSFRTPAQPRVPTVSFRHPREFHRETTTKMSDMLDVTRSSTKRNRVSFSTTKHVATYANPCTPAANLMHQSIVPLVTIDFKQKRLSSLDSVRKAPRFSDTGLQFSSSEDGENSGSVVSQVYGLNSPCPSSLKERIQPKSLQSIPFRRAFDLGYMTLSEDQALEDGVSPSTIRINSTNALQVRFSSPTGSPILLTGDSASHDSYLGALDDYQKILCENGFNKNEASSKWIRNHLRWIVWKLASFERRFSGYFGGNLFTFQSVAQLLLSRASKELKQGGRSCIRQILNRDIAPSLTMVLCVASIVDGSDIHSILVEMTDGCYSIVAKLDGMLSSFVAVGKIFLGCKVAISNASLDGSSDGVDPLDDNYSVKNFTNLPKLILNANGTRLAHWKAPLGFTRGGGPIVASDLKAVHIEGGVIPALDVFIQDRKPLQFFRRQKNTDHKGIVLSIEEEAKRLEILEKEIEIQVEKIRDEVSAMVEKVCFYFFCYFRVFLCGLTMR